MSCTKVTQRCPDMGRPLAGCPACAPAKSYTCVCIRLTLRTSPGELQVAGHAVVPGQAHVGEGTWESAACTDGTIAETARIRQPSRGGGDPLRGRLRHVSAVLLARREEDRSRSCPTREAQRCRRQADATQRCAVNVGRAERCGQLIRSSAAITSAPVFSMCMPRRSERVSASRCSSASMIPSCSAMDSSQRANERFAR